MQMSTMRCVTTQHLSLLHNYDPQIMHGKQIGNRKQTFLEKQGTLSETKLIFVAFNQGARVCTK